jgi:MtN3 and saliva related transmembrane protein
MSLPAAQIIGIGASVCTGISLLPQLIKIIKEKKAESVSMVMIGVLFTGLLLWTIYGVFKKDFIIIISNSFSLLMNILIVIFSIKYKEEK